MTQRNIALLIILFFCSLALPAQNWTSVGTSQLYYAGPVAIGTSSTASTAQGYLLSVEGQLACEEVLIQLSQNWADYVFLPGYNLLPIDQLPAYLAAHEHLPNMPSAKVIETEGLDLAPATGRLLEKIEELTLYLIEDAERDALLEEEIRVVRGKQ